MYLKITLKGLWIMCRILVKYCFGHYRTLTMIEGVFTRKEIEEQQVAGSITTLDIRATDDLYQIVRTEFIADKPIRQQVWMATYGWQCNGHLIEIGGDRYCIFDPQAKVLYLEDLNAAVQTTVEIFTKNF